ncbi:MAG TPA: anti-sigma factor [Candidatus Binataceae bacterium]|nr:anti-sigma factor [Candidatus Binataceae bacterium]
MTHDELKALLPLAALERLEPAEIEALREHLAGCPECDAELREFEHTLSLLALAVDGPATAERVTRKLEARLAAPAPVVVTAAPTPPSDREPARVVEPARRSGGKIGSRIAIAAAIILAIYGAAITSRMIDLRYAYDERGNKLAYLQNRFNALEQEAKQSEQKIDALSKVLSDRVRLEQVLDAPDLQVTRLAPLGPAPQAHALVATSKSSGYAVLRVTGLEPPPPGKTYELWWITKQKGPEPAGTFTPGTNQEFIEKVDAPPAGEHVMASAITLEPAGGVPKPTGVMYLKGSPDRE